MRFRPPSGATLIVFPNFRAIPVTNSPPAVSPGTPRSHAARQPEPSAASGAADSDRRSEHRRVRALWRVPPPALWEFPTPQAVAIRARPSPSCRRPPGIHLLIGPRRKFLKGARFLGAQKAAGDDISVLGEPSIPCNRLVLSQLQS